MQMDILEKGQKAGTLTVRSAGLYLQFTARCKLSGSEVKRLRLCGTGCEYLLGIPIPENGALMLAKTVSKREFDRCFPKDAEYCLLEPVTARKEEDTNGWTACEDPGSLFIEQELCDTCPSRGVYIKQMADMVFLAFPLLPGQPFPLLPIFRFGHTEEISGREYVVFCLKNGKPA